jgi:hypothetical protein
VKVMSPHLSVRDLVSALVSRWTVYFNKYLERYFNFDMGGFRCQAVRISATLKSNKAHLVMAINKIGCFYLYIIDHLYDFIKRAQVSLIHYKEYRCEFCVLCYRTRKTKGLQMKSMLLLNVPVYTEAKYTYVV